MTVVSGEVVPARTGGDRSLSTDPPDRLRPLTAGWLLSVRSPHTRRAYRGDLREWLAFCDAHDVNPIRAERGHVDAWVRWMEATPVPSTGRPPAPATVARRVSAVTSWYAYLAEGGTVQAVPVNPRTRPRVTGNDSPTIGLSRDEARAFLAALAAEPAAYRALALLLLLVGLRVSEATSLTVGSLQNHRGHRTVRVMGKGQKPATLALPPPVVDVLEEYLHGLAETGGVHAGRLDHDALLFPGSTGRPIVQAVVFRLVRRVAKRAGIKSWRELSPHSLRHSYVTLALDSGRDLRDVQDGARHEDPRTTRRYDRQRGNLDRSVSYSVAAFLA